MLHCMKIVKLMIVLKYAMPKIHGFNWDPPMSGRILCHRYGVTALELEAEGYEDETVIERLSRLVFPYKISPLLRTRRSGTIPVR